VVRPHIDVDQFLAELGIATVGELAAADLVTEPRKPMSRGRRETWLLGVRLVFGP
jgi:hypothetical protein